MTGAGTTVETEITAIGSAGDGIAETIFGRFYVPFAAPGDAIRATWDGKAFRDISRIRDGSARRTPDCPHFGRCGGCALQHFADSHYAVWKRDLLVRALSQRRLTADIEPLVRVRPGSRRRARFGFRVMRGGAILGFKERGSRHLVDLQACSVLAPEIVGFMPSLRRVLGEIPPVGTAGEASVSVVDGALDVAVQTRHEPDLAGRERLAQFGEAADLGRLSWGDEIVVQRRPVRQSISGIIVDLPPEAFLQPTEEGETILRQEVLAALAPAGNVVDLFAGCGAFALSLAAAGKSVRAMEVAAAQVAAMSQAARGSGFGATFQATTRDLARQPLAGKEFSGVEGVVLDPPRAGAAPQVETLAESGVPVIVYVSCNPATFARDARILADGGYRLLRVVPLDQFPWSPHLELVAVMERD